MAEKGMSINVTGNQGTAHSVYAIGIHQGTLNVNHSTDEDRLFHLKDQIGKDTEIWNRGMVKVSAIGTIIEKLQTSHRWVTVTGNAGDGKTTLAYMVLKHLQDEGKEVFKIDTPEDFFLICRNVPNSVILINDVLGAFDFDQRAFSTWLPAFHIILERQKKETEHKNVPSIIFVSRLNVLEAARNQLGKYGDVILGDGAIVNPDKMNSDREKLEILNFHLDRHNISDIPESTKKKLESQSPHGFPHCCEMYVELRASGHAVDILKFFSSPLKFLNYTTQVLIDKEKCFEHFKILLKAGGQLDISSVTDATLRTEMQSTASSLMGSYLKTSEHGVVFSHPSIHESVAVAVGNKDPLFAAQEFPISLIMQKCKVRVSQELEKAMFIFLKESPSAMDALMQRLATEIRHGNYTVIQHELCTERKFCEELIRSSTCKKLLAKARNRVGINQRDRNSRTLLQMAVECRNYTASKILLERGASANKCLTHDTSLTILHELVSMGDTDFLELFLQHGADVECTTDEGVTLLHCSIKWVDVSATAGCIDVVALLLKYGANVNKADGSIRIGIRRIVPHVFNNVAYIKSVAYGKTALHYACQNQDVDVNLIRLLIDHGSHVNQGDENGETALHYLCQREDQDEGIDRRGKDFEDACRNRMNETDNVYTADDWQTLLNHLCQNYGIDEKELDITRGCSEDGEESEETRAIRMLIQHGANVHNTNKDGQTALHFLCQGTVVDVRTVHLLLQNDAGVNAADDTGNTPLHYICQRHKADISTLYLLTEHSVDKTLKNKYGHTALHCLCQRQKVRLDKT